MGFRTYADATPQLLAAYRVCAAALADGAFAERDLRALVGAFRTPSQLNDSQVVALVMEQALKRRPAAFETASRTVLDLLTFHALALSQLGDLSASREVMARIHAIAPGHKRSARLGAFLDRAAHPAEAAARLGALGHAVLFGDPKLFLLYADCLARSGQTERARALALAASRRIAGPDLRLAFCNLAGSTAAWRDGLNEVFAAQGMSAIAVADGRRSIDGVTAPKTRSLRGPLVSVVMTTFNSTADVARSVGSILGQDYDDIELLVVDDGSTDDTVPRLRAFAESDARLTILPQAVNRGSYACKNIGLAAARGRFATCHDSDDWAHPARIAEEAGFMLRGERPAAVSRWVRIDEAGLFSLRRTGTYAHPNPASIMIDRDRIPPSRALFQEARVGADTELLRRIELGFGEGAVGRNDKVLTLGRARRGSLTRGGATDMPDHGFSPLRHVYIGRWVDGHVAALAAGAPPPVAEAAHGAVDDLPGLSPDRPAGGAYGIADIGRLDRFARLRLFWGARRVRIRSDALDADIVHG